jgi:hypothetical protein
MRNTTSYKQTTTARNGITRTINRRDDAALTTREVASIFNRLMFRPGKWVGLTGFSEGATRWGQGTRRAFGNVHCYDDAVTLTARLQALVDSNPRL